MMKVSGLIIGALLVIFVASDGFANGGDQRIVEGKYLINLARSPFTPRVGGKIAMLISFVDIQKNALIREDLSVAIRIAKLGGIGTEKREFLFERDGIPVAGGVLEFPYTFTQSGLHEIFIDFAFASRPEQLYEAPDFLLDVQKPSAPERSSQFALIATALGTLIGFLMGWFVRRPKAFGA